MGRHTFLGYYMLVTITGSLAWNCSDYKEKKLHPWCEHGCCFRKDRCCTWAESMGTVFWTFVGLGSGMLFLSIVVGVVCRLRKKIGFPGQIISLTTNSNQMQDATRNVDMAMVSEQNGRSTTNTTRSATAEHVRIQNCAMRSNRVPPNQRREAQIWTTANQTNRHYISGRPPGTTSNSNTNLRIENTNIANSRTNTNARTTAVSGLNQHSARNNNISSSNVHSCPVNSQNNTTSHINQRSVNNQSANISSSNPRGIHSNNGNTIHTQPRRIVEPGRVNTIQAPVPQTSEQVNTQESEEPPPSYESLFKINS